MPSENDGSSSVNLVKLQNTKLIHRNLLQFYTLTTKDKKEKLRKQSYLPSYQKEYLGINLLKEAKHLYSKNYKTLMKETEDDTADGKIYTYIYRCLGLAGLTLLT